MPCEHPSSCHHAEINADDARYNAADDIEQGSEHEVLTEKLKTLVTESRKGGEATAKPYYGQPACMGIELTRIFESNAEESDDQTTQEIDGECSQRNETDTVGL